VDPAVRPAAAADLPALARLAVAERGGQPADWQARFAAELADPDACLLLAQSGAQSGGQSGAQSGGQSGGPVAGYGRARRFAPPPGAPANVAPAGYYLTGLLVSPAWRRLGIGEQLTRARMAWAATRAPEIWFFANAANIASLRLHQQLGFREVTRDFTYPGVTFTGGAGVLCRAPLTASEPPS
jgi:ribosomal protein S18 acetylase RimI-like enzyme